MNPGKRLISVLAALAGALDHMPESARDIVIAAPLLDKDRTRVAKHAQETTHANRTGLNRRARRILASKARRGLL